MKSFSIKELERFSTVKAHTIRTWEKRYSLFNPDRARGNVRHYSLDDSVLLLNISLLVNHGHKISSLLGLPDEERELKIFALKNASARQQYSIIRLIKYMYTRQTDEFEATLDEALLSWGIDVTIDHIILPFMEKVQILSYKDSSIETHFAVTAIRKKLILGIEKTLPIPQDAKTALLFLPKGEHFDLVLLYMCYKLRSMGIKVLYLGTNISNENLEIICSERRPQLIYTYYHQKIGFPIAAYTQLFQNILPDITLQVANAEGSSMQGNNTYSNVSFFNYRLIEDTL